MPPSCGRIGQPTAPQPPAFPGAESGRALLRLLSARRCQSREAAARSGSFVPFDAPRAGARRGWLVLGPQLLVCDVLALPDLHPGSIQDGTKSWRVSHQQTLDLFLVLYAEEHGNGPAVASDHDRSPLAGLEVGAELRFDIRNRRDLHSSISSPPTTRR